MKYNNNENPDTPITREEYIQIRDLLVAIAKNMQAIETSFDNIEKRLIELESLDTRVKALEVIGRAGWGLGRSND